ncbi:zf-DHHC-domain-containing protein [Coprinopsis marcescibilis]|uniref:Palmitoyltransferase n=1 Tax=Coprinopsis marcescibilis TaxID=230819 RepID=A0A5C3L472_COPMA|nr:zf-DHHC-domain-containing protein [Coprinopsis marcescibilis]
MSQDSSCCGVVQESAARAREDRYNNPNPPPWIVLKLMVAITLGIMGYAAYVYIALFTLPMIRKERDAETSKATGIGLLVVFLVLYAWMVWAYYKVVCTPPGYARDYVKRSNKPLFPKQDTLLPTSPPALHQVDKRYNSLGGPSYEDMTKAMEQNVPQEENDRQPEATTQPSWTAVLAAKATAPPAGMERSASTMTIKSGKTRLRFDAGEMTNPTLHEESSLHGDPNSNPTSTLATPIPAAKSSRASTSTFTQPTGPRDTPAAGHRLKRKRKANKSDDSGSTPASFLFCCCAPCASQSPDFARELESGEYRKDSTGRRIKKPRRSAPKPKSFIARRPPMTPFLHPAHRFCEKDEIVKPYRAHHCRTCGTCVLKYDHHCPWIGQCVGARNHKFFLNFCEAAFFCTAYVFGTLLPYTVRGFRLNLDFNPQQLVVIALAALFAIFTFTLAISHIYLIVMGQTTVESMQIRTMKHRESQQLMKAFSCWQISAKRFTLKEWDQEWGKLDTEGNLWWIGGKRREWEHVMGTNPLGWILPIGRGLGDGLDYPVNPRFDSEGKWRRREDWPPELR